MPDQQTARSAPHSVAAPAVSDARGDLTVGRGSWCTCSATAVPGPNGPVMVLRVAGEVDLSTVDLLRTALGSMLAQRRRSYFKRHSPSNRAFGQGFASTGGSTRPCLSGCCCSLTPPCRCGKPELFD